MEERIVKDLTAILGEEPAVGANTHKEGVNP
jgi:hypothetical protein